LQSAGLPAIQQVDGIAFKVVEPGRKLLPGGIVADYAGDRRLLVSVMSGFENDCHRDETARLQRSLVAIDTKPAEAPVRGRIELAVEFEGQDVFAETFVAAPFGSSGLHKVHCTSPQGQRSVMHKR